MIAGFPKIRTDTQIVGMFRETTPEAQDFLFVTETLVSANSVILLVESPPGSFKRPTTWKKVKSLTVRLENMAAIERVDSFLPMLENMYSVLAGSGSNPGDLFDNPKAIPQMMYLVSSSDKGKRLLYRYVDENYASACLTVRLSPDESADLTRIVRKVREAAVSELKHVGDVQVTGHLALAEAQSRKLIRVQGLSLFLALSLITLLMIIQFRSVIMGLLSLIPNSLPLAVIFGIMGWFDIRINSMTILVAAISFGFSLDDTIHYLTHLRRELASRSPSTTVQQCLDSAYSICAKALISTSAVFFFGLLALLGAPFKPSASFGLLAASAALAALIGDLVFMPAVILSSGKIQRLLEKSLVE
jgi:predicted RND superfamily exporter protein